jgi:hypothetical membrane protein
MRIRPAIHHLPILAFLLFVVFVGLAFAAYPHPFSLIDTNISRLGRPSMNPDGHLWLMVGLFATQAPLFIFYATLGRWKLGQETFDRLVDVVQVLSYVSGTALLMLAIFDADQRLPHRIFGGIYFLGDALLMLVACFLIPRHPHMDNGMIPVCLASAVLDIVFLASQGRASWAEWATVVCSYTVAIWLGMNAKRLRNGA